MTIKEIYEDLFNLPNDVILAHCISADFALGAGIAAKFTQIGVRDELFNCFSLNKWDNKGYCLITTKTPFNNPRKVGNLVTKEKCYNKPTLQSLTESLIDFRDQLSYPCKIGMPRIGCGLDRLKWPDVKSVIEEVFIDKDCEIIICNLKVTQQ